MTDVLRGVGGRLPSADLLQQWVEDYARGRYTEVGRTWESARQHVRVLDLVDDPRVVEAVGWSLALTKRWDAYAIFRSDVRNHATLKASKQLLSILDAWHAIHEARYDASLFVVRTARAEALSDTSPRVLSHAFKVEGVALFRMGKYDEAEVLTRRALDLFRLTEDALNVAHCATNLGLILNARGEIRAARDALHDSVAALLEADAAEERLALARANLAIVETHLGHVDAARRLYASALETFEGLGLRSERVTALNGLGHCARLQGDFEGARKLHTQALGLCVDLPRQEGLCHEFLGQICFDTGELDAAEAHYRAALETAATIAPDGDLMVEVCWHYAELLAVQGRVTEASEFVERAEALCEASGDRRELGCVERARARTLAAAGRTEEARAAFRDAYATLEQAGRRFEAALTLLASAELDVHTNTRCTETLERVTATLHEWSSDSEWLRRVARLHEQAPGVSSSAQDPAHYGFVTCDRELLALLDDIPDVAATAFPVLLEGESGTGKELVARAIHAASTRKGAFVPVNCAAIPRDLFESELFGHIRGAFSGALAEKPGLLEQANHGTLFLDEVGEMPTELQAKLLRVLDDGQTRRLGALRERHVDVKIVAATNRPLERRVDERVFRRDLFHRLAVHHFTIKPLRERPDDIALLARHLRLEQLGLREPLSANLLADLRTRPWPGNVRELRNVLIRLATQRSARVHVHAGEPSAPDAGRSVTGVPESSPHDTRVHGPRTLKDMRADHERQLITATLGETSGNVTAAARTLGMHVTTLRRKMKALGVRRPS